MTCTLVLMGLVCIACIPQSASSDLTAREWGQFIDDRSGATVVFVWASWSRESIELLPSVFELEREYDGLGVEFVYLSLDVDSLQPAVALMRELDGPPFYRLIAPLEEVTAVLNIHEPPAFLGYPSEEQGAIALQPGPNGTPVSPADAVALIERLLPENL